MAVVRPTSTRTLSLSLTHIRQVYALAGMPEDLRMCLEQVSGQEGRGDGQGRAASGSGALTAIISKLVCLRWQGYMWQPVCMMYLRVCGMRICGNGNRGRCITLTCVYNVHAAPGD